MKLKKRNREKIRQNAGKGESNKSLMGGGTRGPDAELQIQTVGREKKGHDTFYIRRGDKEGAQARSIEKCGRKSHGKGRMTSEKEAPTKTQAWGQGVKKEYRPKSNLRKD